MVRIVSVQRRLSLAWPLAAAMALLVVYASLYPFVGWRSQGVPPWAFLLAPWPRYWTWFDLWTNLVGYMPLGLLLALAAARTGWGRWAWFWGAVCCVFLSLVLETAQSYLPDRVPSNVDWGLNSVGGACGAGLARVLLRWRWLGSWTQFRQRWWVHDAQGGLLLLLLWPLAMLYPTSVPYGLGQVAQRVEAALARALTDTPFLDWLPRADTSLPLSPLAEAGVVALCAVAPLWLAYALVHTRRQRWAVWGVWLLLVPAVEGLSAALTWGPGHAWAWLHPAVVVGLVLAAALGLLTRRLAHRACAVLMSLALSFALGVLNRAPATAYFAQSLEIWEQGRFSRFHGLSQWLGWCWPYVALVVGLRLALRRTGGTTMPRHE